MPHTKDSDINFYISSSENNGVWNLPYTFLFGLIILFLFSIAQSLALVIPAMSSPEYANLLNNYLAGDSSQIEVLSRDGERVWPAALWGGLIGSLLIILFIQLKKGVNLIEYLDLRMPSLKQVAIWLIGMVLLFVGFELVTQNSESFESHYMDEILQTIYSPYMALFAIGVIGPIFEELFFRGFLFKGIERSQLGSHAAVWITSILFAVIHLQYNWNILVFMVIPMALLLGYSKLYSRSILVPILLHVLNNVVTTFMAFEEIGTM